jgi:hypothetical protein
MWWPPSYIKWTLLALIPGSSSELTSKFLILSYKAIHDAGPAYPSSYPQPALYPLASENHLWSHRHDIWLLELEQTQAVPATAHPDLSSVTPSTPVPVEQILGNHCRWLIRTMVVLPRLYLLTHQVTYEGNAWNLSLHSWQKAIFRV